MIASCALPDKPRIGGLYLITPDIPAARLLPLCAAVVRYAAVLQYRALPPTIQTARQLAKLCADNGALFIVNNDATIAKASNADGVHLGADDMPVLAARRLLGDNAIIGATCGGDIALATRRAGEGADYCAFGAVYPSATKPEKAQLPPDTIAKAKATLCVPVVAIGGITTTNAAAIVNNGADAIAVSAGIFASTNPAQAAKALSALFPRQK